MQECKKKNCPREPVSKIMPQFSFLKKLCEMATTCSQKPLFFSKMWKSKIFLKKFSHYVWGRVQTTWTEFWAILTPPPPMPPTLSSSHGL